MLRRRVAARATAASIALAVGNALHAQDGAAGADAVRAAFAQAAATVGSIAYDDALYGRFGGRAQPERQAGAPGLRELAALCARGDRSEDLVPLLADTDAKVRVLALLVLFDRDEPQLLPHFAALRSDKAPAIDAATPNHVALIDGKPSGPRWSSRQTAVGEVAMRAVGLYLDAAGAARGRADEFDAYWQARKDRAWCASWLAVALLRAHGGSSPAPAESAVAVAAVRKRVLALPSPVRELLLLALPAAAVLAEPCDAFATEAERLAAARALGDDGLLAALGGKVPGDDPDLAVVCGDRPSRLGSRGLQRFVLDHATAIFAPSSAEKLLAFEREQRGFDGNAVDVRWVTTAASLQPAHADEWLRAAYDRFAAPSASHARAALLIAMYDLVGEPSARWVADRFWELEEQVFGEPARVEFVRHLSDLGFGDDAAARTRARAALRALVEHRGLAGADGVTLRAIARTVNRWHSPFVIDVHELEELQHPLGLQELFTKDKIAAAAAQHPEETARYLATLQAWRERLAATVSEWAPK
jgi:hypothetical protein